MSLLEWLREQREAQDSFVASWLSDYPQDMDAGEWDEQFNSFVSNRIAQTDK